MKKNAKWIITVLVIAFLLSIFMTVISSATISNAPLWVAIIIILIVIFLGIAFDIIGVAVTSCDITPFHSMSSRKIRGGKVGVKLIKNTSKVSSICCDVIGDVCGIVSGTCGAVIVTLIAKRINANEIIMSLFITGIISSLTIGGKALGKGIAISKSKEIVTAVSKLLSIFEKR